MGAMQDNRRAAFTVVAVLAAIAAVTAFFTVWGVPSSRAPVTFLEYRTGGFGMCEDFGEYQVHVDKLEVVRGDSCRFSPYTTTEVSQGDMDRFLKALDQSGFRRWHSHYSDITIIDGGGFYLTVKFADGKTQTVNTLNRNPPRIQAFRDALAILHIPR